MGDNKNGCGKIPAAREHIQCPTGNCQGQLYTVRAWDTLYLIARRFGITVQQIRVVNPQIINPNLIYIGQVICIPTVPSSDGHFESFPFGS
ncbi:MAG: LysM domain-containing protein [Bacillota bacterium]|nr:LysM domain-containing protein [Bacillota bacterium]